MRHFWFAFLFFATFLEPAPGWVSNIYITVVLNRSGAQRYKDSLLLSSELLEHRRGALASVGITKIDAIANRLVSVGFRGVVRIGRSVSMHPYFTYKFSANFDPAMESMDLMLRDFLEDDVYFDYDGIQIVKRIVIDKDYPSSIRSLRLKI